MNQPPRTLLGVSLKMYFDHEHMVRWATEVAGIARRHEATRSGAVELFVLPSFPSLPAVVDAFRDTAVAVGAQDLFWEDRGAFTGEVSGRDLAQLGCAYVEVGHAERRSLFHETDDIVARKTAAAIRNGLIPVICVGESQRISAPDAANVCIRQLESALALVSTVHLDNTAHRDNMAHSNKAAIVVAYEPAWAIGADVAATPAHIREVCSRVREWLTERKLIESKGVIYGGSAGQGLLSSLGDSVDGLFLGRFAHDPDALEQILAESLVALPPFNG